jgi:hypothetical protein
MKKVKNDALNMRVQRGKNHNGLLRKKRNDTFMRTIEIEYNRGFKVGSDMQLGTFLQRCGVDSLNDLINGDIGKR